MVEVPFIPSEVLQVPVVLYLRQEFKSPLNVSEQVLVGVTSLAPLEVV